MSILERLEQDMKKAAKARDAERLGVIRFVRAQTKNRSIELGRELEDDDVLGVLAKIARQHGESIAQFKTGGREELVAAELRKLDIVKEYLPQELDDDELEELVRTAIDETGAAGPRDIGAVMKVLMPRVRGRAEGGRVKSVVESMLARGD